MRIRTFAVLAVLTLVISAPGRVALRASDSSYQTRFAAWRSADDGFAGWTRAGTLVNSDGLQLDPSAAPLETDPYPPLGYSGHNFYNGGSYQVGEATSPEIALAVPAEEAIASWNADTPPGTWVETLIRAGDGTRWTRWYNLGIWASDNSTIERHSVSLQGDADGYVAIDTLVLDKKFIATTLQLKVRLFTAVGATATATVRNLGLTYSDGAPKKGSAGAGDPARWGVTLDVPECSQMVYPDGGTVWCSPTSTSMVLAYWTGDAGPCEPRVRAAVAGVFDWRFNGHGNWPFNTAYAAAQGLEAYVARFSSMAQLEPWVSAGVPVVMSYAWKKDLTGAPLPASPGHLAVLVGFDASGNPVVNDPAAASDAEVRRVYARGELEALWLSSSGGTVYLMFPRGYSVPPLQ